MCKKNSTCTWWRGVKNMNTLSCRGGSKQNRSKKCSIGGICSIHKVILNKQKVLSQQSDTQSEVEEICLHDCLGLGTLPDVKYAFCLITLFVPKTWSGPPFLSPVHVLGQTFCRTFSSHSRVSYTNSQSRFDMNYTFLLVEILIW